MKRLLAALAGIAGIAWWRRRQHEPEQAPETDPAEELRAKLAASREPDPEPDPEPEQADVADRRQDVHARARAAIDELTPGE